VVVFYIVATVLSFLCLFSITFNISEAINRLTIFLETKDERDSRPFEEEDKKSNVSPIARMKNDSFMPQEVQRKIRSKLLTDRQIEVIRRLPWKKYAVTQNSDDTLDIRHILLQLDETHHGMASAKKEFGRYLVSSKNFSSKSSSVLLLNGSPGTGKTTLASSIARAMGRRHYVLNLNGLYSAAEILGSEVHFVGSQVGAITKAIMETDSFSPIIIFDEIDKCSEGKGNGNIWDALMQLFDPSQNDFRDVFLDISYDISNILFIATSNNIDNIPKPLLNRMSRITVDGYSFDEKKLILQAHIIPNLRTQYSKASPSIEITEEEIDEIIYDDTEDEGVRNISRRIENLLLDKLLEKELLGVPDNTDES